MANELEFDVLDDQQIEQALGSLPGWRRDGAAIARTYELGGFMDAIGFVNSVAEVAEEFNHHPDITINYRKVTIRLWTHKKNATTRADVTVAGAIDRIAR